MKKLLPACIMCISSFPFKIPFLTVTSPSTFVLSFAIAQIGISQTAGDIRHVKHLSAISNGFFDESLSCSHIKIEYRLQATC